MAVVWWSMKWRILVSVCREHNTLLEILDMVHTAELFLGIIIHLSLGRGRLFETT